MTLKKNGQYMTTHSCLNIIKIFHEHAHFIIGMLQKEKSHGIFSKPSYGPLHYYTHNNQLEKNLV